MTQNQQHPGTSTQTASGSHLAPSNRGRGVTFWTVVGTLANIVGIVGIIFWDVFDTTAKRWLGLAFLGFLIPAYWLTSRLLSQAASPKEHWFHTGVVAMAAITGTALALAFWPGWIGLDQAASSTRQVTYPAPNTEFNITSPTTRAPLCTPVSGLGKVPADKDLWIIIEDDDGDYWPIAAAKSSSNEWVTRPIEIGTADTPDGASRHLHAMLLDKETSAYLTKLVDLTGGKLYDEEPPPNAIPVADRFVTRRADTRKCGQP
jgi:hypothetical protein